MKNRGSCLISIFALGACSFAQAQQSTQFDFKLLDKLGKNAKETSNITLDENTLRAGASLLGGDDKDSQALKEVLKGVRGIVIRSFEYDRKGMYSITDLDPVRAFFRNLNWNKIVDVKSEDQTAEIYLNTTGESRVGGLAILTTGEKEVAVIYINGSIPLDKLWALSGKMGIPDLSFGSGGSDGRNKVNKKSRNDESGKKEEQD